MSSLAEKNAVQVSAAVATVGLLVAAVWWASDITSQVKFIRDAVNMVLQDHETRLRVLEKSKTTTTKGVVHE
jgi:hypothetical protein